MFFVFVFFVFVFFVLVLVLVLVGVSLSKLERGHCSDRFVHQSTVILSGLDDIEEAFLEGCAVGDQDVCIAHGGNLLSRCLKVVRVRANRHDDFDVHLVADEILHNVAENVGRHGNGGCISVEGLASNADVHSSPARRRNQRQCKRCTSNFSSRIVHAIFRKLRIGITIKENCRLTKSTTATYNENRFHS